MHSCPPSSRIAVCGPPLPSVIGRPLLRAEARGERALPGQRICWALLRRFRQASQEDGFESRIDGLAEACRGRHGSRVQVVSAQAGYRLRLEKRPAGHEVVTYGTERVEIAS